jgi:acyl-CoA thioester hydrolase
MSHPTPASHESSEFSESSDLAGQAGTDSSQDTGLSGSARVQPLARSDFKVFRPIQTRWADNDVYGHVNNVVYYSWFDTAVNGWLVEGDALDIHNGHVIGLVVHTQCHYFAPIAFPQEVTAGIRVLHAGRSSVRYQVALFAEDGQQTAAWGEFVHVYVDRTTRRPTALPPPLLQLLEYNK